MNQFQAMILARKKALAMELDRWLNGDSRAMGDAEFSAELAIIFELETIAAMPSAKPHIKQPAMF